MQRSLLLFKNSIHSEETYRVYKYELDRFISYFKLRDYNSLVSMDAKMLQTMIEDYVMGNNVVLKKDVVLGIGVTIGDNTIIEENVKVGDGSDIGDDVLVKKPDTVIGIGVMIEDDVLIEEDVTIGDGATVTMGAVVPKGTIIAAGTTFP